MLRYLSLAGVSCIFLAGCGFDQPVPPAAPSDPAVSTARILFDQTASNSVQSGLVAVKCVNDSGEDIFVRVTMRVSGVRVRLAERLLPANVTTLIIGPDFADSILVERSFTGSDGTGRSLPADVFFLGQGFSSGSTIVITTGRDVVESGRPSTTDQGQGGSGGDGSGGDGSGSGGGGDPPQRGPRTFGPAIPTTEFGVPAGTTPLPLPPPPVQSGNGDPGAGTSSTTPDVVFDSLPDETIVSAGSNVAIAWAARDDIGTANLVIFLDPNGVLDGDEVIVRDAVSPADVLDRDVLLDTSTLAPGKYAVGAFINDGTFATLRYAAGPIVVQP